MTNSIKPTRGGNSHTSISGTPFVMSQPINLFSFLSMFSPIILAAVFLSATFFYQNAKGLVYVLVLVIAVTLRSFILQAGGSEENQGGNCGFVKYTNYGNATFTIFVFAFTIFYMFIPMYQSNNTNFLLITFLLVYLCIDIGIKIIQGCLKMPDDTGSLIGNFVGGGLVAALFVILLPIGKYLFYSDNTPQDGTKCSMPKKQSFKCQVYRNGELVK